MTDSSFTSKMSSKTQKKENLNGILLLNKPLAISSNDVLQIVKRLLNGKKAGHAGTLDPLATGLLIILLGEATKFAHLFSESSKIYEVTAHLGITTETGDIEGKIISEKAISTPFTKEKIEAVLEDFRGPIMQQPPIYSALKQKGQPLYKLARNNISINNIPPRPVFIKQLEIVSSNSPYLTLKVECSKGTYIRSLIHDIGEALGCGAYCKELKRTEIDQYKLDQASSLLELKKSTDPQENVIPFDSLIPEEERTVVSDAAAFYLLKGQSIVYPGDLPENQEVLYLYSNKGNFLGTGKIPKPYWIAPTRLIAQNNS